ncbi:MAG: hypothetical protein LBQ16_02075 [Gracilibacteraceae bacterium]|nr:hypothetical protein [Gracilibacteraceae bacterium]
MKIGQIAVITDGDGQPSSPEAGKSVRLYARENSGAEAGEWRLTRVIPYGADFSSLAAARAGFRALIAELGDACRVVAARTLSGAPYQILNQAGFAIFEVPALSSALFDEICRELESAVPPEDDCPLAPVRRGEEGHYFLDFTRLSALHPEITSKMALREFLAGAFYELTVICAHLPPWIEQSLPDGRLSYTCEKMEDGRCRLVIRPILCHE